MESIISLVERRLSAKSNLIELLIISVAMFIVMCLANLAIHIVNMSVIIDEAEVLTSSASQLNLNSCRICHSLPPISAKNHSSISPLILTNSENLSKQLEAIKQQSLSHWLVKS